jgi:hypothetical protein
MKSEKSLFIKILVWCYEKQENGFLMTELEESFNLTPKQKEWLQKAFRSNMSSSENLIDHLSYQDSSDQHRFFITEKGINLALNHLNYEESNKVGLRAEKIALASILIGAIVGLLQVAIAIVQLYAK